MARRWPVRCAMPLAAPLLCTLAAAGAAESADTPGALADGGVRLAGMKLSTSLMVQAEAQHSEVPASPVNPGNQLAQLPAAGAALELRPELRLDTDSGLLRLFVSPRLRESRDRLTVDGQRSSVEAADAWVQAWGVRVLPTDELSLAVGRDVLQWGPAASYSPSNPLYTDNGKSNPYAELGGTDLAQVQWFAAPGVTLSLVDNFGAGRNEPAAGDRFRRTRLVKLDLTGDDSLASVNVTWREHQPQRIGFYAQKTASDALLLYAEGGYTVRPTQWVAVADGDTGTLSWQLPSRRRLSGLSLLGAAYTLAAGPTLSGELLYNSQGWNDRQATAAGTLVGQAGAQLGGPGTALAMQQLAIASEPGSLLLRRNYLFAQYHHPGLWADLDVTLRATHNLDDGSNRFSLTCESPLGRRYTLFCQFTRQTGGAGSEFGRYLRQQVLVGARAAW